MSLENTLEEYLKEKRTDFLIDISKILFFTFLSLTLLCFCKNIYFPYYCSLFVFIFYLFSTVICFYVWIYISRLNLYASSILITSIFFSLILIVGYFKNFQLLFVMSFLIGFVILLIILGVKWAFGMILLTSIFLGIRYLLEHIGIPLPRGFSPSPLWEQFLQLKSYWLFSFLLYILYKGCIMSKVCNDFSANCLKRYKYLATLEYKHRLLGKISKCLIHDISTSLSILSGSVKLLGSPELNKVESKQIKKSALDSLVYLEEILDNSFLLLKTQEKEEHFLPDQVVKKSLLLVEQRLEKKEIEIEDDIHIKTSIYGQKALFARAILNVLINSIEELEKKENGGRIIGISSKIENDMYLLFIKDSGDGIKEDVLKAIRSGEATMKSGKHLGLGLFFVFETIENHFKGTLEIESKEKTSTEIIFKIPLPQ